MFERTSILVARYDRVDELREREDSDREAGAYGGSPAPANVRTLTVVASSPSKSIRPTFGAAGER